MDKCREKFERWEWPEVASRLILAKGRHMGGKNLDEPGKESWGEDEYVAKDIMEYFAQLPAPASSVPTVDMLTDVVYQDNTALLTNVEALYIARAVHALLTKGRGKV